MSWVRYGPGIDDSAVLSMSSARPEKNHVGEMHAGEVWTDILLVWEQGVVVIEQDGWAKLICSGTSVCVYIWG